MRKLFCVESYIVYQNLHEAYFLEIGLMQIPANYETLSRIRVDFQPMIDALDP